MQMGLQLLLWLLWWLTLLLLPLQRRPNLERALFDVVDVEMLEVTIVASRQGLKLQIFPYSSSSTLSQRDMQDLVHVIVVAMLIPMLSSSKLLKI